MFRFFENLVDPFAPYQDVDVPPNRLLPFLNEYTRPFRGVFVATAILKIMVAAFEIGLIWYMGRLIDLLGSASPQIVVRDHTIEFALAAIAVLFVRTLISHFRLSRSKGLS